MNKQLLLLSTLLSITACTDSKIPTQIQAVDGFVSESMERIDSHIKEIETKEQRNEALQKMFNHDSDTLDLWADALIRCEAIETSKCLELKQSLHVFKLVISENAEEVLLTQ
ncbi:hypothetical protein A1QO_03900 [Vibrio genomosp. F10 str. ZF-129]|uniref:Lipoprotein n=1 Tax=Vibrio genomosp. F10 str. ZF-129 TaxID=1187848 RepID=A0A1E5BIJ0_9VIBR|nr:hypothetical protein [Vibrio genomosp. F10]OEE37256.1 hypothetical protein A1QO_03900 [Vibrio genomosp. F10 str. ZF-129]